MKKFILLFALLMPIFLGCGKEDKADSRLAGTSYRTDGFKAVMQPIWGYYYHVLEFSTSTAGIAYWTDKNGNQNGTDGEFTYTLTYPDLYVTFKDEVRHYTFSDARTFVYIKDDGTPNTMLKYYKQ